MKTYKLIKEYPGSPELGEIVNDSNIDDIDKYPEFWEEIIKKDYEILFIISKVKKYITPFFHKFEDNKDWDIYSVKRLSDNKIFTVGDEIEHPYFGSRKIENIYFIEPDRLAFYVGEGLNLNIRKIKKIPKFLFITQDDSPIFTGDSYWCVNTAPHLWSIFRQTAKENTKFNKGVLAFKDVKLAEKYVIKHKFKKLFTTEDGVDIFEGDKFWWLSLDLKEILQSYSTKGTTETDSGRYKKFSTKEAAEEYAIENKPCLSVNDVKSCLKDGVSYQYHTTTINKAYYLASKKN